MDEACTQISRLPPSIVASDSHRLSLKHRKTERGKEKERERERGEKERERERKLPNHQCKMVGMQNESSVGIPIVYALHTCFCMFGTDWYTQSVLINKISASEFSQKFIERALFVGYTFFSTPKRVSEFLGLSLSPLFVCHGDVVSAKSDE